MGLYSFLVSWTTTIFNVCLGATIFSSGFVVGFVTMRAWEHKSGLHAKAVSYGRLDLGKPVQELIKVYGEKLTVTAMSRILPLWVQYPDYHRASWIDRVLLEIWPYMSPALADAIKVNTNLALAPVKPAFISFMEITSLDMGPVPPIVGGIKTYNNVEDSVVCEMDAVWAGNATAQAEIRMFGLTIPITVSDVHARCIVRFTFKPLIPLMPCFGLMSIQFIRRPQVDFAFKLWNFDIMATPGVHHLVRAQLAVFLEELLAWPNKIIDVPMVEGDFLELKNRIRPKGSLFVRLVEAKGLANSDVLGKSDPFVEMWVNRGRYVRSTRKSNDLNPVWGELFAFQVLNPANDFVHIRILDYDDVGTHHRLGVCKIKISDLQPDVDKNVWAQLFKQETETVDTSGKDPRGAVHVVLRFHPYDEEHLLEEGEKTQEEIDRMDRELSAMQDPIAGVSPVPLGVHEESDKGFRMKHLRDLGEALPIPGKKGAFFHANSMAPVGMLVVRVKKGENLVGKEKNATSSDPYALLRLRSQDATSGKKTRTIKKNLNPQWDEAFDFQVRDPIGESLLVEVWHNNIIGKKFMGRIDIDLLRVLNTGKLADDFPLADVANGKLGLELEWTSG